MEKKCFEELNKYMGIDLRRLVTPDVIIGCDTLELKDPCLVIRLDRKTVKQVKAAQVEVPWQHPAEVFTF